jgi:hypothetical protein
VGAPVLKKLAGNPPETYGTAKQIFDERGIDGSEVSFFLLFFIVCRCALLFDFFCISVLNSSSFLLFLINRI